MKPGYKYSNKIVYKMCLCVPFHKWKGVKVCESVHIRREKMKRVILHKKNRAITRFWK